MKTTPTLQKRGSFTGYTVTSSGYRVVKQPEHGSTASGYVPEHRLVAEMALGKKLPPRAVVHHINGDKLDNRPSNLVVCEDNAYHALLHARIEAKAQCGNPDLRRCWICNAWDDPSRMRVYESLPSSHASCMSWYMGLRRKRLGEGPQRGAYRYGWISLVEAMWPDGVPSEMLDIGEK